MKIFLLFIFFLSNIIPVLGNDKRFVFIIPSYNNSAWYKKNLDCVFGQMYPYWRAIYINDCSTDNTYCLVTSYIQQKGFEDRFTIINNTKRLGALCNIYNAVHSCDDNEIIVLVDGDDWLAHDKVLDIVANAYADPDIWLTYGTYTHPTGPHRTCCAAFPPNIIKNNAYRSVQWRSSHLRTFYAWLFKLIKKEDLLYNGEFYPAAWDQPLMFPMLEMSAGRFKYIPDILYMYNTDNPLNHDRLHPQLQVAIEKYVHKLIPYEPLNDCI